MNLRKLLFLFYFVLFCTATGWAEDSAGNTVTVGEAATTITDGWYMLYNVGRQSYAMDNGSAYKMKSQPSSYAISDCARYLFHITASTTNEGKWTIVSSNDHYLSLGNDNSTQPTSKNDFTISLISADGNTNQFYFQDCASNYILDGQELNNSLVGWGTDVPTKTGGNNAYKLIPVSDIPSKTVINQALGLLPYVTIDNNAPILYRIKNMRVNKFVGYEGNSKQLSESTSTDPKTVFYFKDASANVSDDVKDGVLPVYIYNISSNCRNSGISSWTTNGNIYYIQKHTKQYTGAIISTSQTITDNAWNDLADYAVTTWSGDDAGSIWSFETVEDGIENYANVSFSTIDDDAYIKIRNIDANKYVSAQTENAQMSLGNEQSYFGNLWKMIDASAKVSEPLSTGVKVCYIYNAYLNKYLKDFKAGSYTSDVSDATVYYLNPVISELRGGYFVSTDGNVNSFNGWNRQNSNTVVGAWKCDAGSVFAFQIASNNDEINYVTNKKNEILSNLETIKSSAYYSYSYNDIAAVSKLLNEMTFDNNLGSNSVKIKNAIDSYNSLISTSTKIGDVKSGDYVRFKNRNANIYITDPAKDDGTFNGNATTSDNNVWQLEGDAENGFSIKNVATGKYIGSQTQTSQPFKTSDEAIKFDFSNYTDFYAVFRVHGNANDYGYAHINGGNLVCWSTSPASQWTIIVEASMDEVAEKYNELKALYDEASTDSYQQKIGELLTTYPTAPTSETSYTDLKAMSDAIAEIYTYPTEQLYTSTINKVGYPKATSVAATALSTVIANMKNSMSEKNATELTNALSAYKQSADIATPEDGKAYTLTMVANDADNTAFAVVANGTSLSATKDENATTFLCHKFTNADGVERYAFVDENGNLLAYNTLTNIYSVVDGSNKRQYNDFTVGALVAASSSNITSEVANRFGNIYLTTNNRKIKDTERVGCFIINNTTGAFDNSNAPYHSDNYSSAIKMEEVADYTANDNQNKVVTQIDAINAGYKYNDFFGEGTGKYSFTVVNPSATGNDFASYQNAINATTTANDASNYTIDINQPTAGFYYIKNEATKTYVKGEKVDNTETKMQAEANKDAIFYIDADKNIMAYENGAYWRGVYYLGVGSFGNLTYKDYWTFEPSNTIGQYELKYGVSESSPHYATGADGVTGWTDTPSGDNASWELIPVTDLPLAIGANDWATFSAPVAVTVPEGATAYYINSNKNEDGTIHLTEIDGAIPANTGVIIKSEGKAGSDITMTITEDEAASLNDNKLKPVVAAKSITAVAGDGVYAFATKKATNVTGFMKINGTIPLNGHKCYLDLGGSASAASFLPIFIDDDVTGINGAEITIDKSDSVIYDLQGRKVTDTQKGRMYIQNGKVFIAR